MGVVNWFFFYIFIEQSIHVHVFRKARVSHFCLVLQLDKGHGPKVMEYNRYV